MSRPVKELKNFQKLMLKPANAHRDLRISEDDLKFYNGQLQRVAEPGSSMCRSAWIPRRCSSRASNCCN
jgi:hypothetical protein